jgi:hypothetical protein
MNCALDFDLARIDFLRPNAVCEILGSEVMFLSTGIG